MLGLNSAHLGPIYKDKYKKECSYTASGILRINFLVYVPPLEVFLSN